MEVFIASLECFDHKTSVIGTVAKDEFGSVTIHPQNPSIQSVRMDGSTARVLKNNNEIIATKVKDMYRDSFSGVSSARVLVRDPEHTTMMDVFSESNGTKEHLIYPRDPIVALYPKEHPKKNKSIINLDVVNQTDYNLEIFGDTDIFETIQPLNNRPDIQYVKFDADYELEEVNVIET